MAGGVGATVPHSLRWRYIIDDVDYFADFGVSVAHELVKRVYCFSGISRSLHPPESVCASGMSLEAGGASKLGNIEPGITERLPTSASCAATASAPSVALISLRSCPSSFSSSRTLRGFFGFFALSSRRRLLATGCRNLHLAPRGHFPVCLNSWHTFVCSFVQLLPSGQNPS